ncbi:MAG: hypothetical protein NTW13_06405 [Candidatus Omnitrophica bacterium]|nr:hypothetical protein [Candidatus Omnitrophota bacterium]
MKIKGLATGIGSLPHEDAQKALDLIFKSAPNIPFWPQLPQRDIREGMIAQFSENLPCLRFKDKSLYFDSKDQEKELEKFYERIIAEDTDYFKISDNFAKGLSEFYRRLESAELNKIDFIKIQVTGPFTFGAAINDQAGKALLYDKVLMQAILKGLNMKALWQIKYFKTFGKKMILFVDEPYLGCFGSAYTPLNREDVVAGLTEFTQNLKSEDTLLGIHCCGNTDWSVIIDIKNIDIIVLKERDIDIKIILKGMISDTDKSPLKVSVISEKRMWSY